MIHLSAIQNCIVSISKQASQNDQQTFPYPFPFTLRLDSKYIFSYYVEKLYMYNNVNSFGMYSVQTSHTRRFVLTITVITFEPQAVQKHFK